MKKIIVLTLFVFLFAGCGKIKSLLLGDDNKSTITEKKEQVATDTKQETTQPKNSENDEIKKKELELKEKELELKEKELEMNKNKTETRTETRSNDNYDPNHRGERNYRGTPGDYPAGSLRYLSYSDVAGLTKWQLSVMRNEIYARHGYIFTANMDIKRHFESKSWYYPSYYNVDGMLSKVEKWNINFIKSYE